LPAVDLEDQLNRSPEVLQALFPGLSLTIGTGEFQARSPEATFVRFTFVEQGGKSLHEDFYFKRKGLPRDSARFQQWQMLRPAPRHRWGLPPRLVGE